MTYEFTNTWFDDTADWGGLRSIMTQRKTFLEIGSYEGRSSVYMIENLISDDGTLYCIDTWKGGEEHKNDNMAAVEARFNKNIDIALKKHPSKTVHKMKGNSYDRLAELITAPYLRGTFDFIYIDGSHLAKDVLSDACMCWPLLKHGGVMCFDDYLWGERDQLLRRPKMAVDAFMNIYASEILPVYIGAQMMIAKGEL